MTTTADSTSVCASLLAQHASLQAELVEHSCHVTDFLSATSDDHTHEHDDDHDHDHDHDHEHGHSHGGCGRSDGPYSVWLHVVAIFVVLAASFLGTVIPLLGKYVPVLRMHPFALALGKCAATGVVLAVAMIHMINHAAHAFKEECVPKSFQDSFDAYAFLFAMIAAILMHALDLELDAILQRWAERKSQASISPSDKPAKILADNSREPDEKVDECGDDCLNDDYRHEHDAYHHHHSHAVAAPRSTSSARSIASAVFMEVGVTLHSVFIGLALGIASDAGTKALLVALVFHQMFEGIALGSRLADASMRAVLDLLFALIFSVSAPLGTAIGTAVVVGSKSSLAGPTFVMVRAVSDSVCGGIMLYLGFGLLFGDFPADMRKHAGPDAAHRGWKRLAMYLSLWVGAGAMSGIGKWV